MNYELLMNYYRNSKGIQKGNLECCCNVIDKIHPLLVG